MYKRRGAKYKRANYVYFKIKSDKPVNTKGLVKIISQEFEFEEAINGKTLASKDPVVNYLIKQLRGEYGKYFNKCRQECVAGGYPLNDGYNLEVIRINACVRATHSLKKKAPRIIKKIKKKKV